MKRRSTFGWLDLLKGILFLALGIVTFYKPHLILSGLVMFFGIMAAISGISDIIIYIKLRSRTGWEAAMLLVTGILGIFSGVLLIFNPAVGKWILNVLFPVWFIGHCIIRIFNYELMKAAAGKKVSKIILCLNVTGLLFGVLMLFNPLLFTMSLGILTAINLIIIGVDYIIEAFSDVGASDADWYIDYKDID